MSKSENSNWTDVFYYIGCIPMAASVYFLFTCLFNIGTIYQKIIGGDTLLLCLLFASIFIIVVFMLVHCIIKIKEDFTSQMFLIEKQKCEFEKKLENEYNEKERKLNEEIDNKEKEISRRESIVKGFVCALDKEKYCAELISDFNTVIFEEARKWLLHRVYSAPSAAETVRQLRLESKSHIEELKYYKYKEQERISEIEKNAQQKVNQAYVQRNMMRTVAHFAEERLKSATPFKEVAELYADTMALAYDNIAQELREKVRPAYSTADVVERELKKKIREATYESKLLKYRWEFLLSIFPELKQYTEDEEQYLHLSDYKNYEDFSDNRDRVHDWISDEEYNRLTEDERNQRALDKYKNRNKSKWEIGMEYELYIGYVLRKDGFMIKQFGIENGLNDLGRDIIAEKAHLDGSRNIYIIQCKRWSAESLLHENVVCQLFGTTLEYQIRHRDLFNVKIIPLLVTTTDLSDTAKEFAKRLGVVYKIVQMGEYPMIKCNIDSMIYHLPFDQQYYTTKIVDAKGEKYVWTVAEAVALGYRRAMRWTGNS